MTTVSVGWDGPASAPAPTPSGGPDGAVRPADPWGHRGRTGVRHAERVIGTVVSFDVRTGPGDRARRSARSAVAAACRSLHEVDRMFSTYQDESAVSRFRRGELSPAAAPAELREVIRLCREARAVTDGWFDPWSLPGGFDPTGLVKGWSVDRVLTILREAGSTGAMINAGGDIRVLGTPGLTRPWRVGVTDPGARDRFICHVDVTDAIATSGSAERGLHILDPAAGGPARSLLSATVTGPGLTMVDALATALFAAGEDGLAMVGSLPGYEALVVRTDGTVRTTDRFPRTVPTEGPTRTATRPTLARPTSTRSTTCMSAPTEPDGPTGSVGWGRTARPPTVRWPSVEARRPWATVDTGATRPS